MLPLFDLASLGGNTTAHRRALRSFSRSSVDVAGGLFGFRSGDHAGRLFDQLQRGQALSAAMKCTFARDGVIKNKDARVAAFGIADDRGVTALIALDPQAVGIQQTSDSVSQRLTGIRIDRDATHFRDPILQSQSDLASHPIDLVIDRIDPSVGRNNRRGGGVARSRRFVRGRHAVRLSNPERNKQAVNEVVTAAIGGVGE